MPSCVRGFGVWTCATSAGRSSCWVPLLRGKGEGAGGVGVWHYWERSVWEAAWEGAVNGGSLSWHGSSTTISRFSWHEPLGLCQEQSSLAEPPAVHTRAFWVSLDVLLAICFPWRWTWRSRGPSGLGWRADFCVGDRLGERKRHGQETERRNSKAWALFCGPQLPPSVNWRKWHLPLFEVSRRNILCNCRK